MKELDDTTLQGDEVDLAMDVDLEKRLQEGGTQDSSSTSDINAKTPAPSPPTTLAHDDPENPRNWTTRKKVIVDFALCIWVLSLTYASTAYIASGAALEAEFDASQEVIILGISLCVIGFAGGPLVAGPASEVLGRRVVYAVSGLLFSAFAWGAAFAPNLATLLVCRFLLGFFGGASINNVAASVADFSSAEQRVPYTVLYAVSAFGGPAVGPLCANFIQRDAGFRWNLRVQAILISVTSIFAAMVPETHGPTIMKRRLERQGQAPPKLSFGKIVQVFKVALSRPILYFFTEPIVTLVCIYLSVLYGIMYGFFNAFAIVFIEIRGMTPVSYGMTYIGLGIGFLFAGFLLMFVATHYYVKSARKAAVEGVPTPAEARLTLAYASAIVSPISLFLFAWTAPFTRVHWIVPVIAEVLFGCSMLCLFTAFIPYIVDCYLTTAASALAAGMASRALVGGVFPLFAVQMYQRLTVQGATSLLGGLLVLLAPIPFIFNKYGPRLRAMSKYAVE